MKFSKFLFGSNIINICVMISLCLALSSCCEDCNSIIGIVKLPPEAGYRGETISVSLEGADRTVYLNEKNIFTFHNVPSGIYIVNVNYALYQYEQVLVDVTSTEVKAYQYNLKTGKGLKHKLPFELNPVFKIKYEEDSPNIIGSILKSPYAIIIGVTVLLFGCMQLMPKEQMKESFEQMNKQMGQYNTMFKQN